MMTKVKTNKKWKILFTIPNFDTAGSGKALLNLCSRLDRNFFKPLEKKPIMLENLRNIFYKMDLSEKETRILSSVFAKLSK